ncbi:hypothetical protein F5B21DRAFT_508417 [Xylaria acuta]|nr:hypothetical protein F5B21DRAFT_508417 [Xylaria acuta]
MNDSSIVNSLVDEFQCHICFDLLDDPRPACTWGHTFCKKTSRILEQLRRRVARLPSRDIGLQTDPGPTRSTGQQTDNPSSLDNARGANVGMSDREFVAATTHGFVIDHANDPYQGMLNLRRYHEEDSKRVRVWPQVVAERMDEEQEAESDPGADEQVGEQVDRLSPADVPGTLVAWVPTLLRCIIWILAVQIIYYLFNGFVPWIRSPSGAEKLSNAFTIPSVVKGT